MYASYPKRLPVSPEQSLLRFGLDWHTCAFLTSPQAPDDAIECFTSSANQPRKSQILSFDELSGKDLLTHAGTLGRVVSWTSTPVPHHGS
jgi:hypothetical protein